MQMALDEAVPVAGVRLGNPGGVGNLISQRVDAMSPTAATLNVHCAWIGAGGRDGGGYGNGNWTEETRRRVFEPFFHHQWHRSWGRDWGLRLRGVFGSAHKPYSRWKIESVTRVAVPGFAALSEEGFTPAEVPAAPVTLAGRLILLGGGRNPFRSGRAARMLTARGAKVALTESAEEVWMAGRPMRRNAIWC